MKNAPKTNVMRVLDQHKIAYTPYTYGDGVTALSGTEVAELLGKDPLNVFKTLVTVGRSGRYYVFVVPVCCELTGYVHGGCSPIGMKKQFPTFVDSSARDLPLIMFSGGRIGFQVELAPADLEKVVRLTYADLAE